MRPRLLLHVPLHMLGAETALPGLFQKLAAGFRARGAQVELCRRDIEALAAMGATPDIHLVHNGRVAHPRALNTGLAYIFPFWYCDPAGIFGDSSLVAARFDPGTVDPDLAEAFFAHLDRRLVAKRQSRYDQPQERRPLAKGGIAVFLQGLSDPVDRARHMFEAEMFEAVLAARGPRPVIVKPHPRNRTGDTAAILARAEAVPGVTVTDANVHDILAAAAVTVTTTSATALESMLHRVPVILCGRSDLHHCAEVVRHPGEMGEALRRAGEVPYPFAAFLHWFLAENMLNAGSATLIDDTLFRLRARDVDVAELCPHD